MRRSATITTFVSVGLLTCGACMAQDSNSEALSATKSDSPKMWQQYKQMWKGEWEADIVMPVDVEEAELKRGDRVAGKMTCRPILRGHGLQIIRKFCNSDGEVLVTHRCLASWCPKGNKILLYELSSIGERTEAVIEIVDGTEHSSSAMTQANGEEVTGSATVTREGKDSRKLKVTEGPATGFEVTWTRKKAE